MLRTALVFAALVAGVTGSAQAQDLEALKLDTRKNALPVLPKVVAVMQETVATKGVVEAIPVCKEKAPQLLKEQSEKTGWKMSRVSLKTRNPERGTPDTWGRRASSPISTSEPPPARRSRAWRRVRSSPRMASRFSATCAPSPSVTCA